MPGWIGVGRLAVLADAHVAGGDALHRAVLVVEHFGGRETGKDLDAQRFGLLAQPAAHVAEADDVIAVVLEAGRQHEIGTCCAPCSVRNRKRSSRHRRVERRALVACQSGNSSVSARGSITAPERMCAPTSEPFSSTQTPISVSVFRGELLQPDRRRQSAGPPPTITTSYSIDSRSGTGTPP